MGDKLINSMGFGLYAYAVITQLVAFLLFIYVWKWKKWAVFAFVIINAIDLVLSIVTGSFRVTTLLSQVIGIGIGILVIKPNWKYFE